jgi:hypothetical protein
MSIFTAPTYSVSDVVQKAQQRPSIPTAYSYRGTVDPYAQYRPPSQADIDWAIGPEAQIQNQLAQQQVALSGLGAQNAKNQFYSDSYYKDFMPSMTGSMSALMSQLVGANLPSTIGQAVSGQYSGNTAGQPYISDAPVYSPQQIQQQVNQAVAANDQRMAGDLQGMSESFAGRGLGADSPLMAALASQRQAANLGANTAARTTLPLEAAKANAAQVLQAQMARETQFGRRQNEDLARQQNTLGLLSQILGLTNNAMGGLVA